MKEIAENLINHEILKETFKRLREGSVIHLVINGEVFKVIRNHAGLTLTSPSKDDKPLIIFEIKKDAVHSAIKERNPKRIKDMLRNFYLKGDFKIKLPTTPLIMDVYGGASMLKEMGLTQDKRWW